ncbi:MAG: hypothetical protein HF308_15390 [Ignavibacteria bacterium]|jgi:hypothetical protein|nr:hypothetical protein [Ignavibacteria bacterium]MCU7525862.1 hypothetical protein [Ignavibacteria bacterium]
MPRRFEFRIYDETNESLLVDSYKLDFVTVPSGLGFVQNVSVISTDTVDYIIKQSLARTDIKLNVEFAEPGSYLRVNSFRSWYAKYIRKKVIFYYHDGTVARYMDCVIKKFELSEIKDGYNTVPITIQPLTPFYLKLDKNIIVSIQTSGKVYPYAYPYAYGGGILSNNVLTNIYFDKIPLTVKLTGRIVNPQISLRHKESQEIYATVSFPELVLAEGSYLIIDAINSRVLYFDGLTLTDGYNILDHTKETFLYADPGDSDIVVNLDQLETKASAQISYVQYVV